MAERRPTVTTWEKNGSGWVRTSPVTAIPTVFGSYVDDPSQPFTFELEVRTRPGRRPEVTELLIAARGEDSASITTDKLRGVHVARALTLALDAATQRFTHGDEDVPPGPDDPCAAGADAAPAPRPVRGTPTSTGFLQLVADTYRAAVASGSRSPVEEVRRQFETSRPTAGRWVVQARRAGLLGEALGRTAGEVAPGGSRRARRKS
ncbi:MAG TPA: hypothetical protein VL961_08575 [Acidimicrobiales bacterium]|nr:hypothetical protein [Acidimicrobiales bacterium]